MTSALKHAICRDNHRLLGPYLDGELDPATLMQVEDHVGHCDDCRERAELMRAMRGTLKRVVRTSAPVGMKERMLHAMQAEQARNFTPLPEPASKAAEKESSKLFSLRNVVPVAAAAAFALVWGATTHSPAISKEAHPQGAFGNDLLADLVAEHSAPLPSEHTDPKVVRGLEKYVGVPVRPTQFERGGARFVGARVMPMHQQRAAMLQYVVGGGNDTRRVSVLVYDPQRIQVRGPELTPRAVGTAHVQVGTQKGYNVAVAERDGVGYAIATDLDPDRSAQLAAAAYDND